MGRPRKDFLALAKEKGASGVPTFVTGKRRLKKLEKCVEDRYEKIMEDWDRYRDEDGEDGWPGASVDNLASLEYFLYLKGKSIDGIYGLNPGLNTVLAYMQDFTAAYKRKYKAIPSDIMESMRSYVKDVLFYELELEEEKRPRRWANRNHLTIYEENYWTSDWHQYDVPGTRVNDHGLLLTNIFTVSRIGEYVESSARKGTERGLKYKDLTLVSFWNEDMNPELALLPTKDAKGMRRMPRSKRPRNALCEGRKPDRLCFNPLLPYLAHLLNVQAFRDISTIEELLAIKPPKHSSAVEIPWRKDILEEPFYIKSKGGGMETANAWGKRHRDCGIRAGLFPPPTVHDWRANSLYLIDKSHSQADRAWAGAQRDLTAYGASYRPNISRIDGRGAFLEDEEREILGKMLLDLSIPHKPSLAIHLPAEQEYNLKNSQEYLELEAEIAALLSNTKRAARSKDANRELERKSRKRRTLEEKALRKWRLEQPSALDNQSECIRATFSRCRFMMPERDMLAKVMLEEALLRDEIGLCALRNMMALLSKTSEVEFRPGLEPEKCARPKEEDVSGMDGPESKRTYNWREIYSCYKEACEAEHGFAEFCFLCNVWTLDATEWDEHCLGHLKNLNTFPAQLDPLVYDKVLATAGYCPWCLWNTRLLQPSKRMRQWTKRGDWVEHLRTHIRKLEKKESEGEDLVLECPHDQSRCPKSFSSVLDLRFHLQDIHGIDLICGSKDEEQDTTTRDDEVGPRGILGGRKREEDDNDEEVQLPLPQRKRRRPKEKGRRQLAFINSTTATMSGSTTSTADKRSLRKRPKKGV